MDEIRIRRLHPADAGRVSDCFRRVYGESYANPDFYDTHQLAERMSGMTSGMTSGKLCAVGAVAADGTIVAHMAMSRHPGAASAELGNTVVDPQARGKGIAWKVGAELVSWSQELGDRGFLDYPTTAHHIMQRQSIKTGSETGLMLGYIPIDTDGRVRAQGGRPNQKSLRTAATIVYHPYGLAEPADHYLPSYCSELVRSMAMACEIPRQWKHATGSTAGRATDAHATVYDKRELRRLTIERVGSDMGTAIAAFEETHAACRQIDFVMSDAGIERGVATALACGYWFCGWLPGFGPADVFRLQKVDRAATEMAPVVINPVAQSLLGLIPVPTGGASG